MKSRIVFLSFVLLVVSGATASTVIFDKKPLSTQLYPRDASDSGTVVIAGRVAGQGMDSIVVDVKKAGQPYRRAKALLQYVNDTAAFSISVRLISELSEYTFVINADTSRVSGADYVVCGDAYVLDGQSNIEASGSNTFNSGEWVRTTGYVAAGSGYTASWGIADWSCCKSPGVGMVGANLGKFIALSNRTPVCIINGAVSGTIIEQHQRNDANHEDLNTIYGKILLRARISGLLGSIKGIYYYQGEYHNAYSAYAGLFGELYKDWKSDYPALRKIYVQQVNTGCPEGGPDNEKIREIQRTFGETYPDITVMTTCGIREYTGCHYGNNGYAQTAQWWAPVYGRDFYGATDTMSITSPRIVKASYAGASHTALDLTFDMPVVWPADTLGYKMKDYITLGSSFGLIDSTRRFGNILRLYLSSASNATAVSYIPVSTYRNTSSIYQGPYLRNTRGVGALTFLNFPISPSTGVEMIPPASSAMDLSVSPNPAVGGMVVKIRAVSQVAIFDTRGRKVADLGSGANGAMKWDTHNVPAGIYLVKSIGRVRPVVVTR